MKLFINLLIIGIAVPFTALAQSDSAIDRLTSFPNRLFAKIARKTSHLNKEVNNATESYLKKLEKQESRLAQVLKKSDSNAAKQMALYNSTEQYEKYLRAVKTDSNIYKNLQNADYEPYAHSMGTTLQFLKQNPQYLKGNSQTAELENSIQRFKTLQQNLQVSNQLENYVSKVKARIKQYLAQQSGMPVELTSLYSEYNSTLFEYSEKIRSVKEELNDPDKMFKLALKNLEKLPSFKSFIANNSLLASLFPTPVNPSSSLTVNGLQSRTQLQQMFQGRLPSTPSASNALNENIQDAKSQIDELKDRLTKYGPNGDKLEDPNYQKKSNNGKSLLKDLEYELNFQVQPSTYTVQSFIDFGLGIGYKLGKSNVIGVAFGYHLGYGHPLKNIHFSSQGIGFRTYIDLRIKSNIYLSGGYEVNQNIYSLPSTQNNPILWQPSGLIGISKIVDLKSKFAKKTKVQILWDFLSYYNSPQTPPFKFRVAYAF